MTTVARTLTGFLVAAAAATLSATALAVDSPPESAPAATARPADMAQHHKEMIQRRLDQAASRLEIKASQQQAWQAFATAVQALGDTGGAAARPAADADAATIARDRAERVTAFGRKLTTIADATARLQGVLSPEQKSVLTEITRNAGMHGGHEGFGRQMMRHHMMDGARGDDHRSDHRSMDHGGMDEPTPAAPRSDSN
jgi:hypothetical protein